MDEHKIIVVVVVLGIVAIVMMGLVAKIALLESQVANPPGQMDNLRQNRPPIPAKDQPRSQLTYGGLRTKISEETSKTDRDNRGGKADEEADSDSASSESSPAASGLRPRSTLMNGPQRNMASPISKAELDATAEQARKSLVRLTAVNHHEEATTVAVAVAVAVGSGGLLLASAPFLAGAYEAWCTLPTSKQKTASFNRCVAWSPEINLALVRVDDQAEPLAPLLLSSSLPEKNDRMLVFFESGELDLGRSDATVQGLLNTSDVEKKLERDLSPFGDAVWIEIFGSFPQNIEGAPLVNHKGELAGVALLDFKTPSSAPPRSVFGGGGVSNLLSSMSSRRIYAISHAALATLVEQSTSASANELLFTLAAPRLQKAGRMESVSWSVELPAGETLTAKEFDPPPRAGGTGNLNYENGKCCAALALSDRKSIDGPVTIHDREGRELLRWTFVQGRRHGAMTAFSADGAYVLAAQFQRNERHGYCVYFKNGAPWLVQEYQNGNLGAQHLVKRGKVFYTLPPGKTLDTIEAVLQQHGEWADWDRRLTLVAVNLERWAKELERTQRQARNGRPNLDDLHAAQQDAIAAIEDFRTFVN